MGCKSSKTAQTSEDPHRSESVIRSAILIQKWYRRFLARTEARRRCTWNIFQSIEYAGEQNQLKLYNFFNDLLSQMDTDSQGQPKIIRALSVSQRPVFDSKTLEEEDTGLSKMCDPNSIDVESSYKGVHLSFPLTQAHLQNLIKSFKTKQLLHAKYLLKLLHETRTVLKQKPNINHATTSISKQITICGDLHGKLDDLYMVFHKNGLPSVDNPYIFNGDFVDRGRNSVEIAVILFACLLMNKNEVYLNRGNHEDHVMNIRYGFVKELLKKYKDHATKVIRMFEDVFSWLPIATIIDHKILVVHGGISDTVDLNFLASIDRHKFLSVLHPPRGHEHDTSNLSDHQLKEWKLLLDLLWSDPRMQNGCHNNTFRGGGAYFGPDVTDFILNKYNLKRLIRSHECKADGYEFSHNNKVLTIFSASNYYEEGSNRGAYVKLHGIDLEYHLVQYSSSKTSSRRVTFAQRVNKVESSAIVNLREKTLGSKTKLMKEFQKFDENNTGKISQTEWCVAMGNVLEMDLPWRTLRPKLARCDEHGMVAYETTFEEMRLYHRYSGNGPTITEMLYRQKDNLETLFRILDRDNSGQISMDEFEEVINLIVRQQNLNLPIDQIQDIAKSIDLNHDGKIDFNEFLEAFRIVDQFGKVTEVQKQELMSISSMDSIMQMKNNSFSMGTKRRISNLDGIREQ